MTIGSRQNLTKAKFMNLKMDDRQIEHKPSNRLLGVHIDEMLTWDDQIKHNLSKFSNGLRMLYLARKLTNKQESLKAIYYSLVQPYLDYCDVVWSDCSKTRDDKLQKLQNRAARIITRADYSIRSSAMLNSLEWSNLEEREKRHLLITMFKVFNNNCPTYLQKHLKFTVITPKTNFLKRSFSYRGTMAWNQLSNQIREIGDLASFKGAISKSLGIKWPNKPAKALGVSFTYDNTLLYQKNFREIIVNIKKTYKYLVIKRTFNFWENRYWRVYRPHLFVMAPRKILVPAMNL